MKTKSGFEFEIDASVLDDFELYDLLSQVDEGNISALSKALHKLFDKKTVKRLYDHLRTDKGNVPMKAFSDELLDIFKVLGEQNNDVKNS